MIQKKVCLLGTSGVGKTSLVARFVHSMFSDKYLTTVGVKIDKKTVPVDGTEVTLMIWDLAGDDDFQRLQASYLRGTSGYLLVADGTRRVTLDLAPQWEVDDARIAALTAENFTVIKTSAREGAGVEQAFADLARRMTQSA